MDSFTDEYARDFANKWHQHVWRQGDDLLDFHHPEAMFFDVNRIGIDIEAYTMFRDMMRGSLIFLENEVLAATRQGNAVQVIGSFDVQSKRTGKRARLAATNYLELSDDKVIATIGFLDVAGLVSVLDPVADKSIIDMLLMPA